MVQSIFVDQTLNDNISSIKTNSAPSVQYVVREQTFRIDITGLRPSTPHYMYFERQKVGSGLIKPVGGVLGDQLITDTNGVLSFDFFFQADLPQGTTMAENAQRTASLLAGVKEVVVTNINQSTLPLDYDSVSSSYFVGKIGLSVYNAAVSASTSGAGGGGPIASIWKTPPRVMAV